MRESISADPTAIVVITLTVVLFIAALAVKGFTHDLFLEAGVFLVSAKLILMSRRHAEAERRLELQLVEIKALVEKSMTHSAEASAARHSNGVPAS